MDVAIATIAQYAGPSRSPNCITRTSDGILYAISGAPGNTGLTTNPVAVYKSNDNGWTWVKDVEFVQDRYAANSAYRVSIAVDGLDTVHVAWGSWDGSYPDRHGYLSYATKPKGGSWSDVTDLTDYVKPHSDENAVYAMVIDSLNQVHILYLVFGVFYYFEHHWFDGSWHKETVYGGSLGKHAMLAVDPDNTIYQLYQKNSSCYLAKKPGAPTEVEDTYDTASLTGSAYTVIYNRVIFKHASTLRDVKVKTKTAGDYTLRIKNDGGTITYQTHTIEGAPADSWITFDIDELDITSGDKYRMEVTRPSGTAYAASGLYSGLYWVNVKGGFGAAEFDYTNAMGFVLLDKSGWSTEAIPEITIPYRFCCDKDGNLHFCSGTEYKRRNSDTSWETVETYTSWVSTVYSISVSQDGIVHIIGYEAFLDTLRHWYRSVAGDWSYEDLKDLAFDASGGGHPSLHAIFPVYGTYYPCLLESGYAFAYKAGLYSYRYAADPVIPAPPVASIVTTNLASEVEVTSATLNGTLDDDGGAACDCGFEWGETVAYGNTTPTQSRTTGQTFSQVITGLNPNKTYHFRAFATNVAGTSYGADRTFTTPVATPTGTNWPVISRAYALARRQL